MKQSELEYWKWNAKAAWWLSDVVDMEVDAGGLIKMWKPSPNRISWSPQALVSFAREFLAIAEHIETGRFGPDEERPTIGQIRAWFRAASNWTLDSTHQEEWRHFETAALVSVRCKDPIAAISRLEQRPEAEIVREMLEL